MNRHLLIIAFLLISWTGFAQTSPVTVPTIRIRSVATLPVESPMYIVDGIPYDSFALNTIDINEIESIDILKDAQLMALYRCWASRGVIIIQTKKARSISIKDKIDGSIIAGATVMFSHRRDTVYEVSDEAGLVSRDRLNTGVTYQVSITSIGYQSTKINLDNKSGSSRVTVMMDRELKENDNVTVKSSVYHRCGYVKAFCGGFSCGISGLLVTSLEADTLLQDVVVDKVELYPNPVKRNGKVNIRFNLPTKLKGKLYVSSMSGALMQTQPLNNAGKNQVCELQTDARWPAGTYIITITDERNRKVDSKKFVIL